MIKHILFALVALTLINPAFAQKPGEPSKPTPVIVAAVEERAFNDIVEALGTLKANESVDLTAAVTERVTKVNFEDNQSVKQGDVIVEMDAAEEEAEIAEQKSLLEEADNQVQRLMPLVEKGAASQSALDEWRSKKLSAEARINAIQSRLDQRILKAPYDGVLGLRNISVGALAQPGTLITTIDDLNVMKLDFSVPEIFLSTLKSGVKVQATSEAYPGQIFEGRVTSVDSRIDPITRSIQARALIDNFEKTLRPGLLMQVELQKEPRTALVVQEEALISDGSESYVLVIANNGETTTAERRRVKIGARQFGIVEILEGVEKGEQVITHGTLRVRPGAALEITATEKNDEPLTELLQQSKKSKAEE